MPLPTPDDIAKGMAIARALTPLVHAAAAVRELTGTRTLTITVKLDAGAFDLLAHSYPDNPRGEPQAAVVWPGTGVIIRRDPPPGDRPSLAAQIAAAPCPNYLSAGDNPHASGDRAYRGCSLCGRPRSEHPR